MSLYISMYVLMSEDLKSVPPETEDYLACFRVLKSSSAEAGGGGDEVEKDIGTKNDRIVFEGRFYCC